MDSVINDVLTEYGIARNVTDVVLQDGNSIIVSQEPVSSEEFEDADELEWEEISSNPPSDNRITDINELVEALTETSSVTSTQEDSREIDRNTLENNTNIESTIKENSEAYKVRATNSRFSGATWFEEIQKQKIILAGIGGIGSNVLFSLSRMRPKQITIYDNDIVESVNLSGQLYSTDMIGQNKVDAMFDFASKFSDYRSIISVNSLFTNETPASDIMICGFDNMVARKTFFNAWESYLVNKIDKSKCLFIDGRLSMDEMQIFCITGDDTYNIERYKKQYLFDDKDAEETVCSMKQTTYCASIIGGLIVNLFTNFVANQIAPKMFDLPFKTYYGANMMYFKTEN